MPFWIILLFWFIESYFDQLGMPYLGNFLGELANYWYYGVWT